MKCALCGREEGRGFEVMSSIYKIVMAVSVMVVGLLGVLTILHASIVAAFSGSADNNFYAFLKLSGMFRLLNGFGIIFCIGFIHLLVCCNRKK